MACEDTRTRLAQITLWFFRGIGITFGGLQYESNGTFTVNRFFRTYGYLTAILTLIYEMFTGFYVLIKENRSDSVSRHFMPQSLNAQIIMTTFQILMEYEHIVVVLVYAILNTKGFQIISSYTEAIRSAPKVAKCNKFNCLLTLALVFNLVFSTSMITMVAIKYMSVMTDTIYFIRNILHSISYFHFWLIPYMTWTMSVDTSDVMNILIDDIKKCSVKKNDHQYFWKVAEQKPLELGHIKMIFIKIRKMIKVIDKTLSFVLIMITLHTIFMVFLLIYLFTQLGTYPQMSAMLPIYITGAVSGVVELIISCLVCGRLHSSADKLYAVLDKIDSNSLPPNESMEWIMFKAIDRKSRFGFTIGGFAPLKKNTLIPIFTFILNYTVILLQTAK